MAIHKAIADVRSMGDYRELAAWQRAQGIALTIYRSTEAFPVRERYGLAAQMRRAAVSVVSNIAEGCGRHGDRELTRFLRIARGSVRELECQLLLSRDLGYLEQDVWAGLSRDAEEVSKMLYGLIQSLSIKVP